jgi:hypothetical protein
MNPGLVHSPSNNVAANRRESKDDRSVSPAYVQGSSVPLSDVIDSASTASLQQSHDPKNQTSHEHINSQISSNLLLD